VSSLTVLDAKAVEDLLPLEDAISVLEEGFREGMGGTDPPRTSVPWEHGELLVMPSQSRSWAGVKLITVGERAPDSSIPRIQGTYVLFDATTLTPSIVIDAVALTNLRTAAVSAVAARALSRPDASHLVIFGTGPQARWHARALCVTRPIERVTIVGRNPRTTAEIVSQLRLDLGIAVDADSALAIAGADIICTCTTASTPLFDGRLLPDHVHVIAIGSHTPTAREVDTAVVSRCTVVVENRAAARREAGDLIIPWDEGVVTESVFGIELGAVLRGDAPIQPGPTLFKSVGLAVEDLCVAAAIAERAAS
jgi:ornithine cyclodeaminase/alanine dehydrogenase-like protein (mu-crystallin family)